MTPRKGIRMQGKEGEGERERGMDTLNHVIHKRYTQNTSCLAKGHTLTHELHPTSTLPPYMK